MSQKKLLTRAAYSRWWWFFCYRGRRFESCAWHDV